MQSVDFGHLGGAFKKFVHYNNIDGHYKFHSFILKNPQQCLTINQYCVTGEYHLSLQYCTTYDEAASHYCIGWLVGVKCPFSAQIRLYQR